MEILEPHIKIKFNLSDEEKDALRSACIIINNIEKLIKDYSCDCVEVKDYDITYEYNIKELAELKSTLGLISNCNTALYKKCDENNSIK